MNRILLLYISAAITALLLQSGKIQIVDLDELQRENERQKTIIAWICNDLPTHEACEGVQREARLK